MKKKLKREEDILSIAFRKQVIKEIKGEENVRRKNESLKALEVYRGKTKKWVIEHLSKEFDPETVAQMENRATNVSILRKVVNKLANTYTSGVDRTVEDDDSSEGDKTETTAAKSQGTVDKLAEAVCLNRNQEKADRFFELFRNALVKIIPVQNYRESEEGKPKYDQKVAVLPPHAYDVIEDEWDPEVPRVIILNEFVERNTPVQPATNSLDGRSPGIVPVYDKGDGEEQIIAESPDDDRGRQERHFIWWSDNYHFTTNEKGEYVDVGGVTPADLRNPIAMLPFVFYSGDQDGSFFSEGWQDKVDGAILVNVAMTDMNCIAMVQGWGQPVLTGEKFPEKVKGGPHRAIMLKQQTGVPESKFYYATSNPPLDQWLRMIEAQVALYLSTNNLSPSTVSAKLDVQNMASGIAMLIERSESTADIQGKQKMFGEGEPRTFLILGAWQKELSDRDALTEKFAELEPIANPNIVLKFHAVKPVTSEKEHVETLKARKDLGLNTMLDLVKKDNPELTDEQAKAKVEELLKEKQMLAEMFAPPPAEGEDDDGDPNGTGGNGGSAPPVPPSGEREADKTDEDPKG